MIVCNFQDNNKYINVEGHAFYDKKGKDIVCAGVSCIMYGLINYLIDKDEKIEKNIVCKSGKVSIDLRNYDMEKLNENHYNDIVDLVYMQLYTISKTFPKNVNVTRI